jgi:hypothetical protein
MDDVKNSYDLTFEERDGYLFARVQAESVDQAIAMDYLRKVAARCDQLEATHLMLYRDIPTMLPDGILFFVTTEFLKMIRGVRAAFVNPYLSNTDSMDFAITVGKNRGADYHAFNNTADAEHWLLK